MISFQINVKLIKSRFDLIQHTHYQFIKHLLNFSSSIKCGDTIRLEHVATKKNLHSHHVSSPLSGKQEVSAYGNNGDGDTGDHWMVVCPGDYWERDEPIMLKHIDTEALV